VGGEPTGVDLHPKITSDAVNIKRWLARARRAPADVSALHHVRSPSSALPNSGQTRASSPASVAAASRLPLPTPLCSRGLPTHLRHNSMRQGMFVGFCAHARDDIRERASDAWSFRGYICRTAETIPRGYVTPAQQDSRPPVQGAPDTYPMCYPRPMNLERAVDVLRSLRPRLVARGIRHVAIFGSVSRGSAARGSDIDILVTPARHRRLDLIDFGGVQTLLEEGYGGLSVDIAVAPVGGAALREAIDKDRVDVF